MYSLAVVVKRIWKRKAANLLTALQIFVGVAMIAFSLNILTYTRARNNEFLRNAQDKTYSVSIRNTPQNPQDYIISKEQLRRVKGILGLHTTVSINYSIITFAGSSHLENGENIIDKYVVSFSEKSGKVIAEKEFADVLPKITANNTVNFDDIDLDLISSFDYFDDENEYTHCCILPLSLYWETAQPSTFAEFELAVVCDDASEVEGIFKLEEILSESDEYDFYVGNELYEFLEQASYAKSSMSRIILFSVIVLIMVFTSTVCIFRLLIDERAFEIAVRRASGAGVGTAFMEFAIELLLISITPALLSIISLGLIFRNEFQFIGIAIPCMNFIPRLLAVWGVLMADIICLIAIAFKIYRLKPYELLISEG